LFFAYLAFSKGVSLDLNLQLLTPGIQNQLFAHGDGDSFHALGGIEDISSASSNCQMVTKLASVACQLWGGLI
jgi:hypothetical protein